MKSLHKRLESHIKDGGVVTSPSRLNDEIKRDLWPLITRLCLAAIESTKAPAAKGKNEKHYKAASAVVCYLFDREDDGMVNELLG